MTTPVNAAEGMAKVIAEHRFYVNSCSCSWLTTVGYDERHATFTAHVAAALTEAGNGDVREAEAKVARVEAPITDGHVWAVYDWSQGPYLIRVYATCEEAAKECARDGYGKIAKLPFGVDFDDVIRQLET